MSVAPRWLRSFSVMAALFAIICSLTLTTFALSPLHGHSQQRTCDLCNTAHLPLLQAAQPVALTAPAIVVFEIAGETPRPALDSDPGSADSRAPPFLS